MKARPPFPAFVATLAVAVAMAATPTARGAGPGQAALKVPEGSPYRLVLAYWPPAGWRVRQSGRLAQLELPGVRLDIPVGAVELPAASSTVAALSSEITDDGTVLRIGLGCDCTLAVRGNGHQLLIDIVGAGGIAGPLDRDAGPAPRLARVPPPRASGSDAAGGSREQAVGLDPEIDEMRSRLLDQVHRAAEAGLVKLRPGKDGLLAQLRDRLSVAEETLADAAAPATGPDGPGSTVARAAAPVTPVSASHADSRPLADAPGTRVAPLPGPMVMPEQPAGELREALLMREPAARCIPSEKFALPDPLPSRAFVDELARLRRSLVGEFDRPDPAIALDLARLYLGHGLGAEALQVLAEFAGAEPETPLLAAIARLAQGKPLPDPNVLEVSGCEGQHALWQALDASIAGRPGDALALLERGSGALEQVTHGLRGRMAVRLGLAAAEEDEWITAHQMQAMAERSLGENDRATREMVDLLAALVLRERGDVAEAERRIVSLADARSAAGAEALLTLAETARPEPGAEAFPLEGLRVDLGALATAKRGTPLGARAVRAEVIVTGRLMGRDAALDLLEHGRTAGLVAEADYRKLLSEIAADMEGRVGDTPLAILYESEPERFARLRSGANFRAALARSYLSLGAPALAERILRRGDVAGDLERELADAYAEVGDRAAARRLLQEGSGGLAQADAEDGGQNPGQASGGLPAVTGGALEPGERARRAWAKGDWDQTVEALRTVASGAPRAEFRKSEDARGGGLRHAGPEASMVALRLALAARRAGRQAVPPEALRLVSSEPALAGGLQALFGPGPEVGTPPAAETLFGVLERVSDELGMYREVLEDG